MISTTHIEIPAIPQVVTDSAISFVPGQKGQVAIHVFCYDSRFIITSKASLQLSAAWRSHISCFFCHCFLSVEFHATSFSASCSPLCGVKTNTPIPMCQKNLK